MKKPPQPELRRLPNARRVGLTLAVKTHAGNRRPYAATGSSFASLDSFDCAAASLAIGTRNGEHDT